MGKLIMPINYITDDGAAQKRHSQFTDSPLLGNAPKGYKENIGLVLDKPADFEPDEKYSYSNTNYLLIGEILDKTLGYSHHQFYQE
ncbi:MAG: hypothetical protein R3A12_13330 [Ignavibacteria bacterium]